MTLNRKFHLLQGVSFVNSVVMIYLFYLLVSSRGTTTNTDNVAVRYRLQRPLHRSWVKYCRFQLAETRTDKFRGAEVVFTMQTERGGSVSPSTSRCLCSGLALVFISASCCLFPTCSIQKSRFHNEQLEDVFSECTREENRPVYRMYQNAYHTC